MKYSTSIQECTIIEARAYGKFYVVGTVPASCMNADGGRKHYDTEQDALAAVLADPWIKANPSQVIQLANCAVFNR